MSNIKIMQLYCDLLRKAPTRKQHLYIKQVQNTHHDPAMHNSKSPLRVTSTECLKQSRELPACTM